MAITETSTHHHHPLDWLRSQMTWFQLPGRRRNDPHRWNGATSMVFLPEKTSAGHESVALEILSYSDPAGDDLSGMDDDAPPPRIAKSLRCGGVLGNMTPYQVASFLFAATGVRVPTRSVSMFYVEFGMCVIDFVSVSDAERVKRIFDYRGNKAGLACWLAPFGIVVASNSASEDYLRNHLRCLWEACRKCCFPQHFFTVDDWVVAKA